MKDSASRRANATARRESERYLLGLDDDEVESLAQGVCPEITALKCFEMLRWRREAARNRAREWLPSEAADHKRRR